MILEMMILNKRTNKTLLFEKNLTSMILISILIILEMMIPEIIIINEPRDEDCLKDDDLKTIFLNVHNNYKCDCNCNYRSSI